MTVPARPPVAFFPGHVVDETESEDFSSLTKWTTTNSDLQYHPSNHTHPGWRPDQMDDPIRERSRRRSQIAEPAGTGEFGVGGWAGIPRMRLGSKSDPLGGPDRGRAGVRWGTEHFRRTLGQKLVVDPRATHAVVAHRDGGAVEDEMARVARDAWSTGGDTKSGNGASNAGNVKQHAWEKRGVHPNRIRQSPGGADVVSGLWATSSTSYGGFHTGKEWAQDKCLRSKKHLARYAAQNTAPVRPDFVLSNAAYSGFLTDEEQSKEVLQIVKRQREEAARAAETGGPALGKREMAMLRREARKLNLD